MPICRRLISLTPTIVTQHSKKFSNIFFRNSFRFVCMIELDYPPIKPYPHIKDKPIPFDRGGLFWQCVLFRALPFDFAI